MPILVREQLLVQQRLVRNLSSSRTCASGDSSAHLGPGPDHLRLHASCDTGCPVKVPDCMSAAHQALLDHGARRLHEYRWPVAARHVNQALSDARK